MLEVTEIDQEVGHLLEHHHDISDHIPCQQRWLNLTLLVVVVMRVGLQMVKLLFVVPAQKRHISKKLVSVVEMPQIVITPRL